MIGRDVGTVVGTAVAAATSACRGVGRLCVVVLVSLVRAYQLTLSPMFGPVCRFYPSCSHYAVDALRTHGAVRGTGLVVWRLLRCNPWNAGGVDLVAPKDGCRPAGTAGPTDHSALVAATHDGAPDHPVRAA